MKLRALGVAALACCLALTACGTTDSGRSEKKAGDGGPVSIVDARGTTVSLAAPARRIVTLEWSVTEYALALGVEPIGVADPAGYRQWGAAVPLPGEPTNVGLRAEPSIEAIAALTPDLILADTSSIPDDAMSQMERIAPVAVFKSATADGLVDLVKKNQHDVATLVGTKAEATRLDADFDRALSDARSRITAAGRQGAPMVFVYPYDQANTMVFRMHGPGSAPSVVANAIGLTDASTARGDGAYGLTTTDVEGLRGLPDATHLLYWVDDEKGDPRTTLDSNRVWKSLPFVREGRVTAAARGTWIYGGTKSLAVFAGEVANIVTAR